MTTNCNSTEYTDKQISAWLRGLLTVAYADGNFDREEQELIASLTQDELIPNTDLGNLEIISPQELAEALGDDAHTKENFLRTAVMMAIANGVYSKQEADVVHEFQSALGLDLEAMKSLEATLWHPEEQKTGEAKNPDLLQPVKKWLDGMDIDDPRVARFVCKMIPSECPFERDIKLFGKKIVHIPPMCKLNPLYDQLVGLRFRSLSFLADDCKEDVTPYL
ncbi:Mo-dependent nitrogenase C-terminal domain-containing protein [Geminocystis sp. NIES-3709]|uniref:Mo-dependent nitrogenase C-terminal domain-containing protein n=1 Tax=Geminocystis sp. NIES-3709 TaxID=1617448 RepID=UPI0005FC86BD|nr:Mo-dependent nitrogenase C-terminal domain-containing protein [Geminocystis sp. NIES-3709]BAQ65595.1 hypothetical protein GM3709_2360 [Geminocystis sp. NIES-3709]